jgi:hypothetical protein
MSDSSAAVTAPHAPRVIPGLGVKAVPAPKSKARRHKTKQSTAAADLAVAPKSADDAEKAPATETVQPSAAGLGIGFPSSSTLTNGHDSTLEPEKRYSALATIQKRIKNTSKKLVSLLSSLFIAPVRVLTLLPPPSQQRISGYETSTADLNADQKRAVASKPALETVLKELQELSKVRVPVISLSTHFRVFLTSTVSRQSKPKRRRRSKRPRPARSSKTRTFRAGSIRLWTSQRSVSPLPRPRWMFD